MKQRFLYIFTVIVIFFTSTSFGFLESSTAVHRRANNISKTDSARVNTIHVVLKENNNLTKKEINKSVHESVTETILHWVAGLIEKIFEKIMIFVTGILQSIITAITNFFSR
jgi:cobalamin biosynthesis protein CobD/CbiB